MGLNVFVLGKSGTGKSTSLRNFKSDEILHINVMSKPLPFKGRFAETYNGDNYAEIAKAINATKCKTIVIDDAQYLMANEFMRRSSEMGYQKFTDIANNFWTLINSVTNDVPADVIVYFLMHTDTDDNGNEKAKTIGKLLDEKICIEGMTSIVLKTCVKDGVYTFTTQNNGHDTVKSPLGMFATYEIDNDLKFVDTTIREYWNIGGDADVINEQHDKDVEAGGISTEAPKAERRTRRTRAERTETPADAPDNNAAENDPPKRTRRQRAAESTTEGTAQTVTEDKPKRRRRKERTPEEKDDIASATAKEYDDIMSDDGVPF